MKKLLAFAMLTFALVACGANTEAQKLNAAKMSYRTFNALMTIGIHPANAGVVMPALTKTCLVGSVDYTLSNNVYTLSTPSLGCTKNPYKILTNSFAYSISGDFKEASYDVIQVLNGTITTSYFSEIQNASFNNLVIRISGQGAAFVNITGAVTIEGNTLVFSSQNYKASDLL